MIKKKILVPTKHIGLNLTWLDAPSAHQTDRTSYLGGAPRPPRIRSSIPRISRNIDFQQRNTVLRLQPPELVLAPAPQAYKGLKYAKKTSAIRLLQAALRGREILV